MKYDPIRIPEFPNSYGLTTLAVAIDTSGSTSLVFKEMILNTMKQLLDSLLASGSFQLTVWAFDNVAQYKSITKFSNRDYVDFENKIDDILSQGGGGSSYDESFYLLKALGLTPNALVFITDGLMLGPKEPAALIAESLVNYVVLLHDATLPQMMKVPFKSHVIPLIYVND